MGVRFEGSGISFYLQIQTWLYTTGVPAVRDLLSPMPIGYKLWKPGVDCLGASLCLGGFKGLGLIMFRVF